MQTIERKAQELVYLSLNHYLSNFFGLEPDKIYLMSPPPIYVNERTEETNNIDDTRFPCISIEPLKQRLIWSRSNIVKLLSKVYDIDDNEIIGKINSYKSDLLIRENVVLTIYTTTKKDFRLYNEGILRFFQKYVYGFKIVNDTLPVSQSFNFNTPKEIEFDSEQAPYMTRFQIELSYRIFSENVLSILDTIRTEIITSVEEGNNTKATTIITTEIG